MHEDADELSGAAEFLRELYDAIRGMAESFTARPAISGDPSVIAVAEAAAALLLCFVIARLLAAVVSSLFSRWRWDKLYQTVRARAGDPAAEALPCLGLHGLISGLGRRVFPQLPLQGAVHDKRIHSHSPGNSLPGRGRIIPPRP